MRSAPLCPPAKTPKIRRPKPPPQPRTKIHFSANETSMGSSPGKGQNWLSGIAYFHSPDSAADSHGRMLPRLNALQMEQLFKELGVDDWRKSGWEITLPWQGVGGRLVHKERVSAERETRGGRTT